MNKIYENKQTKKIIIMLLIVMLFNFVVPNYSQAGLLLNAFSNLLLVIPDDLMKGLHEIFLGEPDIQDETGRYSIKLAPGTIFAGKIPAFNVNFITSDESTEEIEPKYTTKEWNLYDIDDTYYGYYGAPETLRQRLVEILLAIGYIDDENYNIQNAENFLDQFKTSEHELDIYGSIEEKKDIEVTYEIKIDNTDNKAHITIKTKQRWFEDNASYTIYEYTIDGISDALIKVDVMPSPATKLSPIIASWYRVMQELALVGLLSVLVYIAIRMILSSAASDTAKYKKLLANWMFAVCIVFILHFLISMMIIGTQAITDVFAKSVVGPEGEDQIMTEVRNDIEANVEDDEFWNAAFYILEYLVLFSYTVSFGIQYLKRVVYIGFLILISPMIAFTYPLDKIKDGKAQAFEFWLKEFIFNMLIQPLHLLLYFMLIKSAGDLASVNKIYAIVAVGALLPAEKFIRKMFGLESKTSMGKMASTLGGAAIMNAINKIGQKTGGRFGKVTSKAAGVANQIRTANQDAEDPLDELRGQGAPTPSPVPTPAPAPSPAPGPTPNPTPSPAPNPAPSPSPAPGPTPRTTSPKLKNKPSTARGIWNVTKTGGGKVLKAIPRATIKATSAITLGTVGLAAGIATGEIENAFAGAAGGLIAGGKMAGKIHDATIRQAKEIGEKFGEGKYGKEEYERRKFDKEFKKSEEYKALAKKYEGQETDIQEFLNVGLTDIKKIDKALANVKRGKYTLKESMAYMKMANAKDCPDSVLYDPVKFQTYLQTKRIYTNDPNRIRINIIDFK